LVLSATRQLLIPLLIGLGVCAACGSPGKTEITAVQLGRSRNGDMTIAQPTSEFKPTDTIYAAVITQGRGKNLKVKARWTYEGALVDEREQTVSLADAGVVPFELRNAGGFPAGKYRLQIFLNGAPAGERELRVKS
jgi:hypothetical protein